MLQLLRLHLSAVSCIVASAPLRASRGVRLRVVFEERLLACHLTDHECPILTERRMMPDPTDCAVRALPPDRRRCPRSPWRIGARLPNLIQSRSLYKAYRTLQFQSPLRMLPPVAEVPPPARPPLPRLTLRGSRIRPPGLPCGRPRSDPGLSAPLRPSPPRTIPLLP